MVRRFGVFLVLFVFVVISFETLSPVAGQTSIPPAVMAAKNAMVLVEVPSGSGSGFAMKGGYVATNCHVIQGAAAIQVHFWMSKSQASGRQAACVMPTDVAAITTQLPGEVPQLELATELPTQGQEVWLWSYPGGTQIATEPSISRGIVSSIETSHGFLNLDITGAPGSSGGPALNSDGKVIAIYSGSWLAGQQVTGYRLGVPAPKALSALASLPGVQTIAEPSPPATVRATVLPAKSIGGVNLGMRLDEVQKAIGLPPSAHEENCAFWATRKLFICFDGGKVFLISTENPDDATEQGLKIGATDGQLITALGRPLCSSIRNYRRGTYLTWYYDGLMVFLEGTPRLVSGLVVIPAGLNLCR